MKPFHPRQMNIIQGSPFKMCAGKCGLSFTECLKARRINKADNRKEMKEQESRNLKGLFMVDSYDRLNKQIGYQFNNINMKGYGE